MIETGALPANADGASGALDASGARSATARAAGATGTATGTATAGTAHAGASSASSATSSATSADTSNGATGTSITHLKATTPPSSPRRTTVRLVVIFGLLGVLVVCAIASLMIGSATIPLGRVLELLRAPDGSNDSYIVNELRTTRTLIGMLVGLALGVAGAVMQAVTRNPLADPGLLGVNSGASLAIVIGAAVGGLTSVSAQFALAAIGALVAAVLVYSVGSLGLGGGSPIRLVLAGVAFSAATSGIIQAVLLLNPNAFDSFRFWDVGALTRTDIPVAQLAVPIAVALVLVLCVSRGLSDIALGDDVAAALGTNVMAVRSVAFVALTLLCATATAAAGPISFIGLMVPLLGSWVMGPARSWIVAFSAVAGPVLILSADIIGRILARPSELQVGLLTAFVGSPFLLYMVFKLKGDRR